MESWISADPLAGTGGGQVEVTAQENTSGSRNGTITVKTTSGLTKSVGVSQVAGYPDKFVFNVTQWTNDGGGKNRSSMSRPCSKTVIAVSILKGTNTDLMISQITVAFIDTSGPTEVFVLTKKVEDLPSGQGSLRIQPDSYDQVIVTIREKSDLSPYMDASIGVQFTFVESRSQQVIFGWKSQLN